MKSFLPIFVAAAGLLLAGVVRGQEPATEPAARLDRFGIRQLNPTRVAGRDYAAAWDNGRARTLGGQVDPDDPWFDAGHGDGTCRIDGRGTLTATGDYVRMYVHDPRRRAMWSPNLEITVYVTRVSETKRVSYSGVQIFARTNHGTTGTETVNLCDDRGYGAKVTLDGRFAFEKETRHNGPSGYSGSPENRPWDQWPAGTTVGVKYILRDCNGGRHVRLELWRDLTGGRDGGQWSKIAEHSDTGENWGRDADSPKPGVDPALPLTLSRMLPDSESGLPMLTVYLRHEFGTMTYQKLSIREIDPLP